ncbi:MAG: hypothetical protein IJD18_01695, partial [Clostridia bacterium]|nr:hypothetical protein [Clostridia bacterium]
MNKVKLIVFVEPFIILQTQPLGSANVTFVKDGDILANDNETSVVTEEDGTPEEYWTDTKVEALKTK